jgi:hypothetical protein
MAGKQRPAESTTKRSRVVFASHHRSLDSYIAVRLGTLYVVTRSAIPESGIGEGGSRAEALMPQTARLALFQRRAAPPATRTR